MCLQCRKGNRDFAPPAPGLLRVLASEAYHHGRRLCFTQEQVGRQVHFVYLQLPPLGIWRALQPLHRLLTGLELQGKASQVKSRGVPMGGALRAPAAAQGAGKG